MATARKTTKEVTTTETVYTLELSEAERDHLVKLTGEHEATLTNRAIYRALTRAVLEENTSPSAPLNVGDRVRILRSNLDGAVVDAGDVLTVRSVTVSEFTTDGVGDRGRWYFDLENEGTGWERI